MSFNLCIPAFLVAPYRAMPSQTRNPFSAAPPAAVWSVEWQATLWILRLAPEM